MFIEPTETAVNLYPIVWVKDQVYFETACGSGSAAVALVAHSLTQQTKLSLVQPSGMSINTEIVIENKKIKAVKIGGKIRRLSSY